MDLLVQIQQIVDSPIKDLLVQLHAALPDITIPVTINAPETVGDVNFGSSFGNLELGSSNFLNPDVEVNGANGVNG